MDTGMVYNNALPVGIGLFDELFHYSDVLTFFYLYYVIKNI